MITGDDLMYLIQWLECKLWFPQRLQDNVVKPVIRCALVSFQILKKPSRIICFDVKCRPPLNGLMDPCFYLFLFSVSHAVPPFILFTFTLPSAKSSFAVYENLNKSSIRHCCPFTSLFPSSRVSSHKCLHSGSNISISLTTKTGRQKERWSASVHSICIPHLRQTSPNKTFTNACFVFLYGKKKTHLIRKFVTLLAVERKKKETNHPIPL